ncbi:hypothetical protein NA56DRAFT_708528 [Hyaloscypha hepaticicola]|uniref:Uncharacterized protein n=1 Tax=Hyaloscypha hepaticicola TaxID=2082293 RepID=A0A2J6PRJ7_9HELO|nr:hypothetical protein NA56DRAFT_708528 [Hyaloscypha hepaticicola]
MADAHQFPSATAPDPVPLLPSLWQLCQLSRPCCRSPCGLWTVARGPWRRARALQRPPRANHEPHRNLPAGIQLLPVFCTSTPTAPQRACLFLYQPASSSILLSSRPTPGLEIPLALHINGHLRCNHRINDSVRPFHVLALTTNPANWQEGTSHRSRHFSTDRTRHSIAIPPILHPATDQPRSAPSLIPAPPPPPFPEREPLLRSYKRIVPRSIFYQFYIGFQQHLVRMVFPYTQAEHSL